jgi:hypothetical protein
MEPRYETPQSHISFLPYNVNLDEICAEKAFNRRLQTTIQPLHVRGRAVPEKIECNYCGQSNRFDATECEKCGASLTDAFVQAYCDRCGVALPEGAKPVGRCVKCQDPVYMCQKHRAKIVGEEIFCKEHESDCFIATAVLGTALDPKIERLRGFRELYLLTTPWGRAVVYVYYEISPFIARRIRHSSIMRRVFRRIVVEPALSVARHVSA